MASTTEVTVASGLVNKGPQALSAAELWWKQRAAVSTQSAEISVPPQATNGSSSSSGAAEKLRGFLSLMITVANQGSFVTPVPPFDGETALAAPGRAIPATLASSTATISRASLNNAFPHMLSPPEYLARPDHCLGAGRCLSHDV